MLTLKLACCVSLFTVLPLLAQDVMSIGSNGGVAGGTVTLPIYVRDVAGTPLGVDGASRGRIQGFAFSVTFSPANAVTAAAFTRSGITANKTPLYERSLQRQGPAAAWVASFAESTNPLNFVSGQAAPGDVIGTLSVTLSRTAITPVSVKIDPSSATLSNQAGTVVESSANGKLAFANGTINLIATHPRADVNGDGRSDLVIQNSSNGMVAGWQMNGYTITAGAIISDPGTALHVVSVADFGIDGKADILLQNATTGDITEWQMNGTGIAASAVVASLGTSWVVGCTGDFNGDGRADILLQRADGNIAEWQMNGTSVSSGATVGNPGSAWRAILAADVDADNKSDVVLQNSATGDVAVWLMNGHAVVGGAVIGSGGSAWKLVASGDVNLDGKSDLFLQDTTTGNVAVWQMTGTVISAGAVVGSPGPDWVLLGAGDFDGDGKIDLILRNSAGDLAQWKLDGMVIAGGAVFVSAGPWVPVLK